VDRIAYWDRDRDSIGMQLGIGIRIGIGMGTGIRFEQTNFSSFKLQSLSLVKVVPFSGNM